MLWDRVSLSLFLSPRLHSWITLVGQLRKSCLVRRSCPFSRSTCPEIRFFLFLLFFFLYLQEEDFRRENYILENMKKDESAFKGECIGKGNAFKKKKYRNDAYRAEFIHFQGRIYNNLQRGWLMVRVLEMILHSSGMNNSCTFCKIFEGNDYHYLSLTNKFIRFVLLVQKKKKKGERNK